MASAKVNGIGQRDRAAARFAYRVDVFGLFLFVKYLDRWAADHAFTRYDLAREAKVPKAAIDRALSGRPLRWQRFAALCAWQGEQPATFAVKHSGVSP